MREPLVTKRLDRRSFTFAASATVAATGPAGSRDLAAQTPSSDGATPQPISALIEAPCGPIRGINGDGVDIYLGIPYGEPPVGDLRWAAPVPKASWTEPLDAVAPGPMSPQMAQVFADVESTNEDCLYLNVTVPAGTAANAALPVMVWLHGGGGTNGSGDMFDATRLVRDNDAIVVTINWRLGVMGAFGMADLEDSGTFGLLDCQLAFAWVQQNIVAFGGDPANVTAFGESYGALTLSGLLVSPLSEGLFHRAIIQSGLALIDYPAGTLMPESPELASMWMSTDELNATTEAMLGEIGLDPNDPGMLEMLCSLPVEQILPLSPVYTRYAWGNRVLPEDPAARIRDGAVMNVPVISGGCRDEARLFVGTFYDLAGQPVTAESYPAMLETAFGDDADAVINEYPLDEFDSSGLAWATVVTDRVWATATMAQSRGFERTVPTWAYEFADRDAPPVIDLGPDMPAGAHHSAEVQYQFDLEGELAPLSESQWELAAAMNAYWANFARSGDPNGNGLPEWTPFGGGDMVQSLDDGENGIGPVDYAADHRLAFWDSLLN